MGERAPLGRWDGIWLGNLQVRREWGYTVTYGLGGREQ